MSIEVKVEKDYEDVKLPTRGSSEAAGYDLYAYLIGQSILMIDPGEVRAIHTGLRMELPPNYCVKIYAKSGMALRQGLRPANCVGVIDSDYRGEIIVPLYNDSSDVQIVKHGDRIAQIIFEEVTTASFTRVKSLHKSTRGEGGFGSTGKE